MIRRRSPGIDEKQVRLTGDGLGLSPAEYLALTQKLVEAAGVTPDTYARGGAIEELESRFARTLGKERAIFMPTGTLANHLAVRTLSGGRGRVAVQEQSHLYQDSGDCVQTLSGRPLMPLAPGRASFTADELNRLLDATRTGRVETHVTVVSVETPVRRAAGRVFDPAELKRIVALARQEDIALHLDGARLFLQAACSGASVASLAKPFDTVYVSLYKYFNAPSGAILAGPRRIIDGMYHERRMFGGSLAQAWPLALVAGHFLEGFTERYAKAVAASEKWFARLDAHEALHVERIPDGTNLAYVKVSGVGPRAFRETLLRQGIELGLPGRNGAFTVAINETFTRRSPKDLADSLTAAAVPTRSP